MKTCEACAAKLEEFARVEAVAKKISAPQLSEAYWENFASRVQNKLAIRERQKTSPAWLEALESFFRPTTGKLAIAGSVAVIILLTFVSLDQWKKETFRPPVFEPETLAQEGKVDSVQVQAKDESEFQTAEKNKEIGLVEDKRLDQPARERPTAILSKKPAENAAAASVPLGRALATPEGQKSNEEPSLAAYAERDEAIRGDTVLGTAGKKAEIRKEVATSQVKVAAEEIEKSPSQNANSLLKLQQGVTIKDDRIQIRGRENGDMVDKDTQNSIIEKLTSEAIKLHKIYVEELLRLQRGVIVSGADRPSTTSPKPATKERVSASAPPSSSSDTTNVIPGIRELISKGGEDPVLVFAKSCEETLYIFIGGHYLFLNRHLPNSDEAKMANTRLDEFLKKELSDSTRQRLLQIQAELKKLKK
ncbi:MAG: hypothetical protein L0196_09625 [candidate division Zixibacteria bacterium]|nr:hypothetical protein [candidate division Zixibacteria bacterium]